MIQKDEPINLDNVERLILNQIQTDFPLDARPYHVLGRRLGLSEEDVLDRVRSLKERGLIRRIGGNFSSRHLGYASTLCAARVPEIKLDSFIEHVNQYEGVTHNYRRDHDLNVWFTFIAPSMEDIEESLAAIARATGINEIYNLPAEKIFKIRVDFKFDE